MTGSTTIAPEDELWLRLDRPTNVLGIVSVLWTATPVDLDELRRLLTERLVDRYPVFRARPDDGGRRSPGPVWVEDPDFDLDRHVRVETLPADRPEAALQDRVGALRAARFDLRHPPWEVHLLRGHGSGSAVVVRTHHALADGVRMMRLLFALTDPRDPGPPEAALPVATHGVGDLRPTAADLPWHPLRAVGAGVRMLAAAANTAVDTAEVLGWSNPRHAWSGAPGTAKSAAWTDAIPLRVLAGLAHEEGATVNDVCLALLGGAVARAQAAELAAAVPSDLAWMMPVNLDPFDAGPPERLGNHFALVLVVLPMRGPFRARLLEVHARVEQLRRSWEPTLTHTLAQFLGRAPEPLGTRLSDLLADKTVGVVTNVPGPRAAVTLAGAEVTGVVGWAPCSAEQLVTACIVSYDGRVRIGVGTDLDRVGEARGLVAALEEELDAVLDERGAGRTTTTGTRRRTR